MPSTSWDAKQIGAAPDAIAPDGSEVWVLCATGRGSTIRFRLMPGAVARAVVHRSVEEIWYVLRGRGRMWRKAGGRQEVTALAAGVSLTVPAGTAFQFRNDGGESLQILAATMPPWPGGEEAVTVEGLWVATA